MNKDRKNNAVNLGDKLSEKELCPDELLAGQEAAFERDLARLREKRDRFVRVPCPACGDTRNEPELVKFGFDYATCRNCGTLFLNPRPTPEIMAQYYADSENYRYWAENIFPASEDSRREKLHRPRLERVLDYCAKHAVDAGALLEVGAGFGTFARLARESGRFQKVVAVEPTPEMAEACRKGGVDVIGKRIEDVTAEDLPPVDVVVSFEVIEHLFDPRLFLRNCLDLLKPGGLLVLSCPNGQGFDISLLREHSLAVDVEHVNLFNPRSAKLLLEAAGFETLEIETPGRLDAEFVREAVCRDGFELKDPFLQRVLVDEWERLGWPFQQFLAQQGLSSHMWLAARKPSPGGENSLRAAEESVLKCYSTWSETYYEDYYASEQAYPPVHTSIVRDRLAEFQAQTLLDAGCGPASMLRDLTGLGMDLYGFDLTPRMVEEARRVMAGHGVPAEHLWRGSVLDRADFARKGPSGGFDAATCIGVLPHVPAQADPMVLENLRSAVRPGGLVMVEARNQLFSLFTLNRYSYELFLDELIYSRELLEAAGLDEDDLKAVLRELKGMFRTDLPPVRKGKQDEPGYDEVLSRTHNPLVLKEQFQKTGFSNVRVMFYHYHCLPPMYESRLPGFFRAMSVKMEDPFDWRGYFMASAFILAGERA